MKQFYALIFMAFICSGIWAQDFKFGKISKEELEETKHPRNKEAHAAVLYRSQRVFYDFDERNGFTLNTEVHERIKIYDKEGFDWATKEISYYRNNNGEEKISNLKGYTYNLVEGEIIDEKLRNNGIFQEEASNYKVKTKFTMPAIKEGSVIEFRYTIKSPFISTIEVTPLQYTIPLNKLDLEVKIPEFFGFSYYFNPRSPLYFAIDSETENFTYKITKQVREGGNGWNPVRHSTRTSKIDYLQTVYSIQEDNVPALKEESYVDFLENYAAFIKWELQFTKFPDSPIENYAQTWEGVTRSIYNDAGLNKELHKTGFFEDDLDALLLGIVDAPSKARAIFEYVRKKVKWNDYLGYVAENGVKKAYKEGQGNVGDINLLLVSMLNYAGIEADPVLVSTRNNGIPLFPTRTGYNYVIAGLDSAEGTILLDASDPTVGFGELPDRARNWQGRIIRKDGTSDWVNLRPTYISENSRTVNVKLQDDLNVVGKCIKKMSGLEAKSYRDKYAPLAIDEYIKVLEKDRGNFIVSEVKKEGVNKDSKLVENYSFELKDAVENISDQLYLKPLLFTSLSENPFKAEERTYPIFFNYPKVESNTINMMIPEGYKVEHLPESGIVQFKDGALTYKFLVTQNGSYLRIESILDINEIVFHPNDYKNLRDFFSLMVEKQSEAIVLKKI